MAEPRITIVEDDTRPSSVVIKKKRLEDFDLGEVIGDGAFGAVSAIILYMRHRLVIFITDKNLFFY